MRRTAGVLRQLGQLPAFRPTDILPSPPALAGPRHFLTLWADADPDIPILKEAKAEYAKLQ